MGDSQQLRERPLHWSGRPDGTPGERIRFFRELHNWSQATLGSKVYATQVAVSHWERDARTPSKLARIHLAEVLGVTRTYLFGEDQ